MPMPRGAELPRDVLLTPASHEAGTHQTFQLARWAEEYPGTWTTPQAKVAVKKLLDLEEKPGFSIFI